MAFFWYQRSAYQGYAEAMYSLASCYERGYGCEKDENKAGKWYYNASLKGHEEATKALGNYKRNIIKKFKKVN